MSSTNKTDNLELNQWVGTDPVLMADFNADNAKLDAAIGALQASALKIATGSYIGDGQCGSGHKNTLTFPFCPKLVFIAPMSNQNNVAYGGFAWLNGSTLLKVRYNGDVNSHGADYVTAEWSDRTLQWYDSRAWVQLNASGVRYGYVAIG